MFRRRVPVDSYHIWGVAIRGYTGDMKEAWRPGQGMATSAVSLQPCSYLIGNIGKRNKESERYQAPHVSLEGPSESR